MGLRKRQFLRPGRSGDDLRPPWLLDVHSFTDACTRCGRCAELCPEKILVPGDGGFPMVDFSLGECTFCGQCTTDCEAKLFHLDINSPSTGWTHKAAVSERCLTNFGVMCRSCEDTCEPRAIRFPLSAGVVPGPVINADSCTGCGACIGPCPEQAISMFSGSVN